MSLPAARCTKIVATLGPASASPALVRALIDRGMDFARINGSHGDHETHRQLIDAVRTQAEAAGRRVGVLFDLQGPKIRLGEFAEPRRVCPDDVIELVVEAEPTGDALPVDHPHLADDVSVGDPLLIDDGHIATVVTRVSPGKVHCRVLDDGVIHPRKGINLPASEVTAPSLTDKDRVDAVFAVAQGVDAIALSFVRRRDDVVELIRGPKGSVVRLEVIPADSEDGAPKLVKITRNTVMLEEQSAQKKLLTYEIGGHVQKIGVIDIPTFYVDFKAIQQNDPNYKSTTRDVTRLINELKEEGVSGIVIDLRNNGGGSLQEADQLTGLFIKSGPTVQVKSNGRKAHVYSDFDDTVAWDGPMAVLVNRLSASASEIFAGAIQDYERGIIAGSQTFGKGTVQTLIPLNRGQLKITQAKYYRVSGQSTQHQGIVPDIAFPEVYDIDRVGESSLDDALQWDKIKPAIYPRGSGITEALGPLTEEHEQRIATDPDFTYLRALAQRTRDNRAKTHVSLNQTKREKEKADDDAWRLALENALLVAKGTEPIESLDELDERASDDAEPDPNDDAMLRETGRILLDYIGLTRQMAMVESGTAAQ